LIKSSQKEVITIETNQNHAIWQQRIDEQISSGLSQKTWCRENNINFHNFAYWKKRSRVLSSEESQPQQFVQLSTKPLSRTAPIVLTIGTAVIEVHENFNPKLLDDLMSILIRYA